VGKKDTTETHLNGDSLRPLGRDLLANIDNMGFIKPFYFGFYIPFTVC